MKTMILRIMTTLKHRHLNNYDENENYDFKNNDSTPAQTPEQGFIIMVMKTVSLMTTFATMSIMTKISHCSKDNLF